MNSPISAVVLCDLPNLQHQPFIRAGKDYEGNKRLFDCLERIRCFMKDVLGLSQEDKWLFGDAILWDHNNLLIDWHERGWKYVACPARQEIRQGESKERLTSVSDNVLKEIFKMYISRMPDCRHYVFISDDTDFLPEAYECLEHQLGVTWFVSGSARHTRILALKARGVNVINISTLLGIDTPVGTAALTNERIEENSAEQAEGTAEGKDSLIESIPEEKPIPAWVVDRPTESPVSRFARRYGTKK